jgi:hypothetical protein
MAVLKSAKGGDSRAVEVESINGPELLSGCNRKISRPVVFSSYGRSKMTFNDCGQPYSKQCGARLTDRHHAASSNNLELAILCFS